MKKFLSKFKNKIEDILYTDHIKCIFCDQELNGTEDKETCEDCSASLPYIVNPCDKCGGSKEDENSGVCATCKKLNRDFDQGFSVFDYRDTVDSVVHKVKFASKTYPLPIMAEYMAQKFASLNLLPDFITYVPISEQRKKVRTFDQGEELSKHLSTLVGIDMLKLVDKVKDNLPQATLPFKDRLDNVKDVYQIIERHKKDIKGKTILIVDDVMTTGITSSEVAKVLKRHGAKYCYVLTFAHALI